MLIMENFHVIIAGSRTFEDYSLLAAKCDTFLSDKVGKYRITIISGAAKGADSLGERYGKERGYEIERCQPDWKHLGKIAGPLRNKAMASRADALIAFWDGQSRGTRNKIRTAQKNGLQVRIVPYQTKPTYSWLELG